MIIPIKESYGKMENQDDLLHDGLFLMAKNITATFMKFNERGMSVSEIERCVSIFRNRMYEENGVTNNV